MAKPVDPDTKTVRQEHDNVCTSTDQVRNDDQEHVSEHNRSAPRKPKDTTPAIHDGEPVVLRNRRRPRGK